MALVFEFLTQQWMLAAALLVTITLLILHETRKSGPSLSPQQAINLVNKEQGVFLDLRDAQDFKQGHIVDAVHIPSAKLGGRIAELEKYKDRISVLHGVNGSHCSPSHGTPFGYLAGLKKGKSPRGQTIDHALGSVLPPTPLPMLGIGLSQLNTMRGTPINYSSSAAGARSVA